MKTLEERVAELEKENAKLRKQNSENFRQQAAEQLIEKYNLTEEYDIFLDYAKEKVEVNDADTISDVADRMYEIIKNACKRSGVEVPKTSSEKMGDYLKKINEKQKDDERYAEELKKSFV